MLTSLQWDSFKSWLVWWEKTDHQLFPAFFFLLCNLNSQILNSLMNFFKIKISQVSHMLIKIMLLNWMYKSVWQCLLSMGQLWVQSLALLERREHLQNIFRGYSAMQCILLLFKIWGLSLYLKKKKLLSYLSLQKKFWRPVR